MKQTVMKATETDKAIKATTLFITNNLGINLCSVDDIYINRQDDGQIRNILITFIPATEEEKAEVAPVEVEG